MFVWPQVGPSLRRSLPVLHWLIGLIPVSNSSHRPKDGIIPIYSRRFAGTIHLTMVVQEAGHGGTAVPSAGREMAIVGT